MNETGKEHREWISGESFLRDERRKLTSFTSPSFIHCLIPLSLHNSGSWLLVLFPLLNEVIGVSGWLSGWSVGLLISGS